MTGVLAVCVLFLAFGLLLIGVIESATKPKDRPRGGGMVE